MSRIRSVHPSQWTEDEFMTCSPLGRLFLLGLRNEADDRGVFEWRPISLKVRILPIDDADPDRLLRELVEHHQITRFEAEGRSYGLCLAWDQQPRRPNYRYPKPPEGLRLASSISANGDSGADIDDIGTDDVKTCTAVLESESESESEGRGTRGRARQGPPPESLSEDWREAAAASRSQQGLPPTDLPRQYERFKRRHGGEANIPDYWRGLWLNWADEAHQAPEPTAANPPPTTSPDPAAAAARKRANFWGRSPDWWQKFDPSQQTRVRTWVETGNWRGSRPPGTPDCMIETELAEAAVGERARRLAEQSEMLLPIPGGATTTGHDTEAERTPSPPRREAG